MLIRFAYFLRCLPKARHALQPYWTTCSFTPHSYSTEADINYSTSIKNQEISLSWNPTKQIHEITHSDSPANNRGFPTVKATEGTQRTAPASPPSVISSPKKTLRQLHERRPLKVHSDASDIVQPRFTQRRLRALRWKYRASHPFRRRVLQGTKFVKSSQDRTVHLPPCRPQLKVFSVQRYLRSPLPVSLGTWTKDIPSTDDGRLHGVRSYIDELDTSWSSRFMRLEEGHYLKLSRAININRFIQMYASFYTGRKVLHKSWTHLPVECRLSRWQDAMLWCMQKSPKRALLLLLISLKGQVSRPPRYMIQNCLQYLTRYYLSRSRNADPQILDAIWHLTINFMDVADSNYVRAYSMSQDVIQILLKHCDGARVVTLYDKIVINNAELHENTMLHFLESLVSTGNLALSMKVLETIARGWNRKNQAMTGPGLFSNQIQSACVRLLRTHWGLGSPYPIQSGILAQMLELGIRPNTRMYNVMLLNMIEGGDFETAWKTFDIAKESDHFKADSITYGVLAKGAKLSGDSEILDKVLWETHENPNLLQDARLVSGIFSAISELAPGNEFAAMLKYYKHHFDLRPLQELGLCEAEHEPKEQVDRDERWPNKYILGQMILAYNKTHASLNSLIYNYDLYHNLVLENHPLVACLAQDDYVANSYLIAFSQRIDTLHYCTTVIKHMLSLSETPGSAAYAAPTVRTWSILAAAYMRHHQKHAAEKVLTLMHARGLTPDLITWNILISGYSAMQDIDGAMGALRQLEANGLESNSRTIKGLGRLWDRGKLLKLLKINLEETRKDDQDKSRSNLNELA